MRSSWQPPVRRGAACFWPISAVSRQPLKSHCLSSTAMDKRLDMRSSSVVGLEGAEDAQDFFRCRDWPFFQLRLSSWASAIWEGESSLRWSSRSFSAPSSPWAAARFNHA